MAMENPDFLKDKYDLHKAPEVAQAANRTKIRSGEEVAQNPADQIQNYLDRFNEILDRQDPHKRERGIEAAKKLLLDKFVTRLEDIPESYWKSQEVIIRERGQQGDYDRFSNEQKATWKKEISEGLLDDQKASLEQWLDYFASTDSDYLPDYLKYWVFRSVTQLSEYDKEKKEFSKRSRGTVKQFPDINHEALAYVIDAVIKKHQDQGMEFEHDIQPDERQAFLKSLKNENFAKLYAWANDLMNPVPEHLLPVTQGEWRKYEQNSDHTALVKSIRGKGTGWCTAGENTAKKQLKTGAFHCYYTLDDEGQPTIPRLAIRMEGDKIAEVRGVAYKQNLDPYMPEILEQKLTEFSDKEEYLKKDRDMRQLTAIDNKVKRGEELNKDELIFLYEIDSPIQSFGYQSDPRIAELRALRNPEQDMLAIFECNKEQIARSVSEINENTKAYLGIWNVEIFQKVRQYPNINHVYESFPDKKILKMNVQNDPDNINSPQKAKDRITKQNMRFSDDMIDQITFSEKREEYDLVSFTVKQLGLQEEFTIKQVYKKAKKIGLELCPAEAGVHLRLQYSGQEWMVIAMKPVLRHGGYPFVFIVGGYKDGSLILQSFNINKKFTSDFNFVFRFSLPVKKVSSQKFDSTLSLLNNPRV